MVKFKNKVKGTYSGEPFINLAGVDFLVKELLEMISQQKFFLFTSRGMYYLYDEIMDGCHNFKTMLIDAGRYMSCNRFCLMKYSELPDSYKEAYKCFLKNNKMGVMC